MQTATRVVVLAALLSLSASSMPMAQARRTISPAATPTPAAEIRMPFDVSTATLAKTAANVSCQSLVASLKSLKLAKDEFESSNAYAQRLESLKDRQLVKGVSLTDTLAVRIGSPLAQAYDADSQTATMTIEEPGLAFITTGGGDFDFETIYHYPVNERGVRSSTYPSSNAFGTRVTVTRLTGRVCSLTFDGICGSAQPIRFNLSPPDARLFRASPGVLFIAKPTQPFLTTAQDVQAPRINDPIEREITVEGIRVEPIAFWFYDAASGRILHKEAISSNCR